MIQSLQIIQIQTYYPLSINNCLFLGPLGHKNVVKFVNKRLHEITNIVNQVTKNLSVFYYQIYFVSELDLASCTQIDHKSSMFIEEKSTSAFTCISKLQKLERLNLYRTWINSDSISQIIRFDCQNFDY